MKTILRLLSDKCWESLLQRLGVSRLPDSAMFFPAEHLINANAEGNQQQLVMLIIEVIIEE